MVVAVGVEARDGHEQRPGRDGARVVGDAADGDVGQPGRADRPAVASSPAKPALGRQAFDEGREAGGLGRFGGGQLSASGSSVIGSPPERRCTRIAIRPRA